MAITTSTASLPPPTLTATCRVANAIALTASTTTFCRSAWVPAGLAREFVVLVVTCLARFGRLTLVVDDTLLHKRGQHVWGLGWFRDAVASTRKRPATASGHNWVTLALVVGVPMCPGVDFCIPLSTRLHRPGKRWPVRCSTRCGRGCRGGT